MNPRIIEMKLNFTHRSHMQVNPPSGWLILDTSEQSLPLLTGSAAQITNSLLRVYIINVVDTLKGLYNEL
jgi:hypothetical protein